MDLKAIAAKMENVFGVESEFSADEIKVFPVRGNGTAYLIDRGEVEFSRGTTIEAYVYIEYPDGGTVAETLSTPGELALWTTHLEEK